MCCAAWASRGKKKSQPEFVVTRKGKSVAKLVPMHKGCAAGQRLGIAKGAFTTPEGIGQHDATVAAQLSQ